MKINQTSGLMLCSLLCFFNLVAQEIVIHGKVKDLKGSPIVKSSVMLFDSHHNIVAYDYTNENGDFKLIFQNDNLKNFTLMANSLGFKEGEETIVINSGIKEYSVLLILKEHVEQLNEVVLKSSQKISENGNVTTLKTGPFTDNTEQTVEDVLKKLPGIEVLNDGSIKAHGKFIDKLLIDGEDLFASNYKLLSKNLDAKVLKSIQIMDKYQDNPVLSKILDSDRVALNLQVKDGFKNIWFGTVRGGLGTDERVNTTVDVGLLRKKIKFLYFGSYNNLGNKASDQLVGNPSSLNLSSAYREVEIKPKIAPTFFVNTNESKFFKKGQSTFNKAFLNTLGFVTKALPNLELRGTGSFSNDIQKQLFSAETVYNIGQNPVHVFEKSDTHRTNSIGSGELELKYTGGERSYLKNTFVYQNQPENFNNALLFNGTNISQELNKNKESFYNHLNYSYAIGKGSVFHNYFYVGQNEVKQNAVIQSPLLDDLFGIAKNSKINNLSNDKLNVYGIQSILFSKLGDFSHKLKIGYESKTEKRRNTFVSKTGTDSSEIDSLGNNLRFKQRKLTIKTSLSYSFSKKVKLSLGVSLSHINIDTGLNQNEGWFFNPEITLDLRKLKKGSFVFRYENTYQTPKSIFFLQNYQLTNYRSFIKGSEKSHLIKRDLYMFGYRWANELESEAVSLNLRYSKTDGNYTTSNQINKDFVFSSYKFINGGNLMTANLDFTSYFESLNLSTNLRTTQSWSATPLQTNSSGFSILKNYIATYLFSGTTYFNFPVNFTFKIATNQSQSSFNSVHSNTHWENAVFGITYEFSKKWHATINNNLYKTPSSSYYFLGSIIDYQPKKSNFSYQLIANNLTNEDNFSNVAISNYTTYRSSIKLIPRYILITAKYRF